MNMTSKILEAENPVLLLLWSKATALPLFPFSTLYFARTSGVNVNDTREHDREKSDLVLVTARRHGVAVVGKWHKQGGSCSFSPTVRQVKSDCFRKRRVHWEAVSHGPHADNTECVQISLFFPLYRRITCTPIDSLVFLSFFQPAHRQLNRQLVQ